MAGSKLASAPYSDVIAEYTTLTTNQQFATDAYTAAKAAYEAARADAAQKQNYAEAFVKPNVPQRSTSPNAPLTIFTTFIVALLAYALVSLLISSFKDQAGV